MKGNENWTGFLWFFGGSMLTILFWTLSESALQSQVYSLRSVNTEVSRKYEELQQENEVLRSIVYEEQKNRSRYNKLLGEDNVLKEDYAELKQSYEDLGKEFEQTVNMLENAVEDCKQTKKKK